MHELEFMRGRVHGPPPCLSVRPGHGVLL